MLAERGKKVAERMLGANPPRQVDSIWEGCRSGTSLPSYLRPANLSRGWTAKLSPDSLDHRRSGVNSYQVRPVQWSTCLPMKNNTIRTLTMLVLTTFAGLAGGMTAQAGIRSHAKDVVVVEPRELPEAAQQMGNSLFVHADDAGTHYLYVEQQQGRRISVFDVSDSAKIKTVSTIALKEGRAFDFVQPLNDRIEILRYRDDNQIGFLDLRRAAQPVVRTSDVAVAEVGEQLTPNVLMTSGAAYQYVPAVARDYQVVDITRDGAPTLLATVRQVKHRTVNAEMGTTFLLGSDGLTVVRQLDIEKEYKTHLMQMQGNLWVRAFERLR